MGIQALNPVGHLFRIRMQSNALNPSNIQSNNSEDSSQSGSAAMESAPVRDTTHKDSAAAPMTVVLRNPKAFLRDMLMCGMTYLGMFWFINRWGIRHMYRFNRRIEDAHIRGAPAHLAPERKKEFDVILTSLKSKDPKESKRYWDLYDEHILGQKSKFSPRERWFANFYKAIYDEPGNRWIITGIIALMSGLRTLYLRESSNSKNLVYDWSVSAFAFIAPFLNNLLFARADSDYFAERNSPEKEKQYNKAKNIAEDVLFKIKVWTRVLKRIDFNHLPSSLVSSYIGSLGSRVTRDLLEDGVNASVSNPQHPFMAWLSKRVPLEKLKVLHPMVANGYMSRLEPRRGDETRFMLGEIGKKMIGKYFSDTAVFMTVSYSLLPLLSRLESSLGLQELLTTVRDTLLGRRGSLLNSGLTGQALQESYAQ